MCDETFVIGGVERPNDKALYFGRKVGMNGGESLVHLNQTKHKFQITMLKATMKLTGVASAKLHAWS